MASRPSNCWSYVAIRPPNAADCYRGPRIDIRDLRERGLIWRKV